MRVLLAASASYVPPRGGATRSNLVWLDQLAAAGHECRVVCASLARDDRGRAAQLREEGIAVEELGAQEGVEIARRGGIEVWSVADPARRAHVLGEQIRAFRPGWVLVSSEDLGHALLREAHQHARGRVIYLAHTPQFYPFGPESWNPDARAAELIKRSAAVVAIGDSTAAYIERHLGRKAEVIHPPIYGRGPFRRLGEFGKGLALMINPCAVKGISIFLDLAARCPDIQFGALPGWGTTAADRRAIEALPNVTLLPNAADIEEVLAHAGVLLMPSLWFEGFGLIVMEAQLRGVPVIASDAGGLVEAKAGTGFVIPTPRVERYEPVFDERGMPAPVVPACDVRPWEEALRKLLSSREVYEAEAEASQRAALRFVSGLRAERLEELLASARRPLRILLAHNSLYYPAHGGGDKSNRLLVEALAARGHVCRVVARIAGFGEAEHERYAMELAARGLSVEPSGPGIAAFRLNGVDVRVATNQPHLRAYFASEIAGFDPDVILASTDDPAQLLLEAALKAERARVVYLVRATLAVPFGPDCAFPSAAKTGALRQADAVVGVSEYVAGYVRRQAGIDAVHVPISLLEPGPWPELGRFDNEFVTFVNPCAVKGISVFLALAERMRHVQFAAVPTWGTNERDRAALAGHPNVHVLEPVDNIDELLARTRVLLAPSLWAEARSRMVLEAQLRGVPVVASDVGGIPEAKMGVPYLVPVRPIERYRAEVDEQMVPVAEVPEQAIGPWQEALERLLTDRAHYEEIARASRRAALKYAENLSVQPLEEVLERACAAPRRERQAGTAAEATDRHALLEKLSPEKRRLLAVRLRKKAWFPGIEQAAPLRLFCFPHAGGGTGMFARWAASLPGIGVCPVRLPGRESRSQEPPFTRMEALVDALADAIRPHLAQPFAFFGHSMGAAVAFELARRLRREGHPAPKMLLVSAARAPQYRRNHVPPPELPEADFLAELRRLEGIPAEALDDPEVMRVLLPALKADAALYRNYIYCEEPPLACPIRAFGGEADPNVTREHLEAWARQTTGAFGLRLFPGGHFYVHGAEAALMEALREEIDGVTN